MIDFDNLMRMVEEKYISVQKHPTHELFIFNYTQKAQFDRVWNSETLQCRGLILDGNKNIIARPFKKFFNLDEAIMQGDQLPIEDFEVTEKMDGSLGILYWVDGKPYLATRGSFVSDQAIMGTKILQEKYKDVYFHYPKHTYLFEIIYPSNRIVIDYGDTEDIFLLAIVDIATGKELSYEFLMRYHDNFPFVKRYDGVTEVNKLKELQEANREGFVIHFLSGQRYKVKFDEYVRLHRLITGVNARTIWDLLRNNQPFEELLEKVPDEFFYWVQQTRDKLIFEYSSIERQAIDEYERVKLLPTRKDQAIQLNVFPYRAIVFRMLDKKSFDDLIWKMLKPAAEKPFKEDIDA